MEKPFPAYTGDKPYIFVCYGHADDEIVYPEITWLKDHGLNIWYDEGISAGRVWRAEVGDAIRNASKILFYISKASLSSVHCNQEINYALDEQKDIIPVYLEDVLLTTDFQVGLSSVQALQRDQDQRYGDHLLDVLSNKKNPAVHLKARASVEKKHQLHYNRFLLAALAISISVFSWWFLTPTESNDSAITVAIERFEADAGPETGFEYEIQRRLSASPRLVVRISDGTINKADYLLKGKTANNVLKSQLIDQEGTQIENWNIALTSKLSPAAGTLSSEVLRRLGLDTNVLSKFEVEIPPETFRNYLNATTLLRRSHTLEALNSAEKGFLKVLNKVPRYAPAHAGLCSTYLGIYLDGKIESNLQNAERHCHRALTLDELDPSVHIALGMLYRETGQSEKAIDSYDRALDLAPYSTDAMRGKADTLTRTGATTEALRWYQEAIRVEPNHWESYQSLGFMQFANSNLEAAVETFRMAYTLAPGELGILNNIAAGQFMLGDFEQAVVSWQQLANKQPSGTTFANLGSSYFFQRDFSAAAEMYTKASALTPNDHRYLGQIGEVYYVSGIDEYQSHFERAIELALRQLAIDPSDSQTTADLAAYYAALGKTDEAHRFVDRAMENGSQDANVVYQVALSHARSGDIILTTKTLKYLITLGYGSRLLEIDANFDGLLKNLPGESETRKLE